MDACRSLFQRERYAECWQQCEQGVKFLTSAEDKLPYHLLASQAALQDGNMERAKHHAELCVKLDSSKMLCWQTLYDVLASPHSEPDHRRIASVLSTQCKIARKNNNLERASSFSKQAAESYERAGELVLASEHWEEAVKLNYCLEYALGLAKCYELMKDTLKADGVWWELCEREHLYEAALKLLSRPAHVILEAKRAGQSDQVKQQEAGAWAEFERRVQRLDAMQLPVLASLLFASQERIASKMDRVPIAQQIVSQANEEEMAVLARAWYLLGEYALVEGDAMAAHFALERAQEYEQRVYARFSSTSTNTASGGGGARVIGTEYAIRSFTGNEVLSLICGKTDETSLARGRCALACFPGSAGVRAGIKSAQRALPQGVKELELCALFHQLVQCSYPFSSTEPAAGDEFKHELVAAFRELRVDVLLRTRAHSPSWFERRMAHFLLPACATLLRETRKQVVELDGNANCELVRCASVRELLARNEADYEDKLGSVLPTLWQARLEFPTPSFAPQRLLDLLQVDDNLPLACELLGKHYMGLDQVEYFHAIPMEQPHRKRVRDGAKAIKYLQLAVQLDPVGLGAVAPLANAYHAAQQEEKARLLYQTVVTATGTSTAGDLLLRWTFVRLGQQQLHFQQPVLASASFQRALAIRSITRTEETDLLPVLCGLAEANESMGRMGAAMQNLERALELAPDNAAIELKLAQLLVKSGGEHAVRAIAILRRLVGNEQQQQLLLSPARIELAEALLEHARFLLVRGSVHEANALLRESLVLFAAENNYKGLGDACCELGEWNEALAWYYKACHGEPWNALARYDLARVLLQQQQHQASCVSACEASVVLQPSDAQSWNLLGMARMRDDAYVAQHCFIRSLQLAPDAFASTWLNLAWTLLPHKPALARRAFSQAQTIEPDSCEAWLGHFKCGTNTTAAASGGENRMAALECAAEAAQYNATDASAIVALLLLGEVLLATDGAKQKQQQLLDVSSRAIQLARSAEERARAWALIGHTLRDAACFDKALQHCEDKDDLSNALLLNSAILTPSSSTTSLPADATRMEEKDASYLQALGRWHYNRGAPELAQQCFERALELNVPNPSSVKLDWLEAITSSPDFDKEFAEQIAESWAKEFAETSDARELARFATALGLNNASSLLTASQRYFALNKLGAIHTEPWNLCVWSEFAPSHCGTVLKLAQTDLIALYAQLDMVFQAGAKQLLLLANNSQTGEPGYFTGSDAARLRLKLRHLCPWKILE